jgi:hypothetical protein
MLFSDRLSRIYYKQIPERIHLVCFQLTYLLFFAQNGDLGGLWDKKERSNVLTLRGEKSAKNIPLNILLFGD